MASKNHNVSHTEIWDDSALVDSWNDAVEEYKKYHSLEARGEDVMEVLKAAENEVDGVSETIINEENEIEPLIDDQQAKKDPHEEIVDPKTPLANGHAQVQDQKLNPGQESDKTLPALPQQLIGQVHDEGLKNLLMSWYYAGYYTGLYEGQQRTKTEPDAKHDA